MDGRPTSQRPSQASGAEPVAAEDAGPAAHGERYGIVEIARYVKDDGRALILYTRAERGTT